MWNARYKAIAQDKKDMTKVNIEIEYYDRPNERTNFFETYTTAINGNLDDIIDVVLNRLKQLNIFEPQLARLKLLVGMDVVPTRAAGFQEDFKKPILKTAVSA
ncbi:MAG TPA: hypothetical protein VJ826_15375 [Candidatus Polarisedimenticolaceae bacterium]|nr:hypothetical protein [Candidatus Polarisedimenticolaceae bacterium]